MRAYCKLTCGYLQHIGRLMTKAKHINEKEIVSTLKFPYFPGRIVFRNHVGFG